MDKQWYKVDLHFVDGGSLTVKTLSRNAIDIMKKLSTRSVISLTQENEQQFVVDLNHVKYSEVNPI